jgi:hypothetical protein
MGVMSGTFPYTNGVFYMTMDCWCIRGPSCHRHWGNRLDKRLSRPYDGDDAHDGELPAYSRCPLCLPSEWAIFNHLLNRRARSWFWPPVPVLSTVNPVLPYWPLGGSPLSPRSPLYGREFWICGRDTRVFSRVYGVSPRGCCGFVVTAVTAMTLMTVIYGLILNRGRSSTS